LVAKSIVQNLGFAWRLGHGWILSVHPTYGVLRIPRPLLALTNVCSPAGRFVLLLYGKQINEVNLRPWPAVGAHVRPLCASGFGRTLTWRLIELNGTFVETSVSTPKGK